MGQRVGCGPEQHLARWPLFDPEHTNGRSRRILPIAGRPSEGPLTERTADVRAWRRELVFVPHCIAERQPNWFSRVVSAPSQFARPVMQAI